MSRYERYPAKTTRKLWELLKPLARQMRHEPTPAEDRLWECLRNRQINNLKFRRQHAIERFIVDYYCAEANLIIEVDGDIHQYTKDEDAVRQEYLETLGLCVLRFSNNDVGDYPLTTCMQGTILGPYVPSRYNRHDVLGNIEKVVQRISEAAKKSPSPSYGEGLG